MSSFENLGTNASILIIKNAKVLLENIPLNDFLKGLNTVVVLYLINEFELFLGSL